MLLTLVASNVTFDNFLFNYRSGKNRYVVNYGDNSLKTIQVSENYNYKALKAVADQMKQEVTLNKENLKFELDAINRNLEQTKLIKQDDLKKISFVNFLLSLL